MKSKNICISIILTSLSFNVTADINETARYWIALGTVAHQCGKLNQHKVSISNEDIGTTAMKESGLNRSQIVNILSNSNQKRIIASKVSALKSDINNGYTSCSDVILAFSSSFMR